MAERRVWQAHAIASVTISLIESRTPAELQSVPKRVPIHANAVVSDGNPHVGRVAIAAFFNIYYDAISLGLESMVHQFSESRSRDSCTPNRASPE